jgi:hypothetical protein
MSVISKMEKKEQRKRSKELGEREKIQSKREEVGVRKSLILGVPCSECDI